MHFDIHLRSSIQKQIERMVTEMKSHEEFQRISEEEIEQIRCNLNFFSHSTTREGLRIAGVDGSGDFPALSYADSFVYFAFAQGTIFESDPTCGLKEVSPIQEPVTHFAWIPEEQKERAKAFDQAFSSLAGVPMNSVVSESDYRIIADNNLHPRDYIKGLIRPHASDSGNIAIQLRASGELGAAYRLLQTQKSLDYVLIDGTFSLPFLGRGDVSLFHEHLKRLCCVQARRAGVGFFALSKSHGMPATDLLEEIAREKAGLEEGKVAEHWFLRLPVPKVDKWSFALVESRSIPPRGAVSYLVRFHKNTPIMRLDMDLGYWKDVVRGASDQETEINEAKIFSDLDYASHDQRCYGYPYPVKAGHDRASLTKPERVALRNQIIDAAVKAGMKRALFQDASIATGHR